MYRMTLSGAAVVLVAIAVQPATADDALVCASRQDRTVAP
jgi:hypothetical protein